MWLKANNPIYADIEISEALQSLPEDGVPEEIMQTAKYSDDILRTEKEHIGYVPEREEGQSKTSFVSAKIDLPLSYTDRTSAGT